MAVRLLILLFLLSSAAHADFDVAAEAYRNKNYANAFEMFMPLAEAGDARAQTVIGMMYKFGESVEPDPAASFSWYLRAAESGYAPAMFNVGEMYRLGTGTDADPTLAIGWLKRAAAAGYARANESLAALNAEPVPSDVRSDPSVPWSKAWNFRLPNDIRFSDAEEVRTEVMPNAVYRAQIGAMKTRAAANRLWNWLSQTQPQLFSGLEPTVLLTERNQSQLYRVQAGPFDGRREAQAFCDRLELAEPRADCLPVR